MKTIPINDKNEMRISNETYKGFKFVSVRIWYLDEFGEWRPGKSGIQIRENQWDDFKEIIGNWEPEF